MPLSMVSTEFSRDVHRKTSNCTAICVIFRVVITILLTFFNDKKQRMKKPGRKSELIPKNVYDSHHSHSNEPHLTT